MPGGNRDNMGLIGGRALRGRGIMGKKYRCLIGGALLWILLQILSLSFTGPSNFLLYDHFMIPELDLKGSAWQTGKYIIVKEGNFLKCINGRWRGNSRGWVFINGQEAKYVGPSKLAETKAPSYSLSGEGEIILPLFSEGKKIDVYLERTFVKILCSPYTALFYFLLIWFFTGKIFLWRESNDKWFCPSCLLIFSVGFLLSFSGEMYFYPNSIGYLNSVCSGWLKTIETNAGTCRTPGYPLFLLDREKIEQLSPETKEVVLAWSPTDLSRVVIAPMYFDLPRSQRILIPFEVNQDNVCKSGQKDFAKDFDLFPKELDMGIICCGRLFPLGLMCFSVFSLRLLSCAENMSFCFLGRKVALIFTLVLCGRGLTRAGGSFLESSEQKRRGHEFPMKNQGALLLFVSVPKASEVISSRIYYT